jgi:hypothetical protein
VLGSCSDGLRRDSLRRVEGPDYEREYPDFGPDEDLEDERELGPEEDIDEGPEDSLAPDGDDSLLEAAELPLW